MTTFDFQLFQINVLYNGGPDPLSIPNKYKRAKQVGLYSLETSQALLCYI